MAIIFVIIVITIIITDVARLLILINIVKECQYPYLTLLHHILAHDYKLTQIAQFRYHYATARYARVTNAFYKYFTRLVRPYDKKINSQRICPRISSYRTCG